MSNSTQSTINGETQSSVQKYVSPWLDLAGMEQAISPFASTLDNTASMIHRPHPLPLSPWPRGYEWLDPPLPRNHLIGTRSRRSSSVYSRTTSQWLCLHAPWKEPDSADSRITSIISAYLRRSTNGLPISSSEPQLLLPRTYSPLKSTPFVDDSRDITPSPNPSPDSRPSLLLPAYPVRPQTPQNHLRTVSLERAKADVNAPGSEHLLPEELIARTKAKANLSDTSHGPNRPALPPFDPSLGSSKPLDINSIPLQSPTLRMPSMMIHSSHWDQLELLPQEAQEQKKTDRPTQFMMSLIDEFPSSSTDYPSHESILSKDTNSELEDDLSPPDEATRGRTRHRVPNDVKKRAKVPTTRKKPSATLSNASLRLDACQIAADYTSLLKSPFRDCEGSLPESFPEATTHFNSPTLNAYTGGFYSGAVLQLRPQPLFASREPEANPREAVLVHQDSSGSSTSHGGVLLSSSSGTISTIMNSPVEDVELPPIFATPQFARKDVPTLDKEPDWRERSSGSIPISLASLHPQSSGSTVSPTTCAEPAARHWPEQQGEFERPAEASSSRHEQEKRSGKPPKRPPLGPQKRSRTKQLLEQHRYRSSAASSRHKESPRSTPTSSLVRKPEHLQTLKTHKQIHGFRKHNDGGGGGAVLSRVAHKAIRVADKLTRPAGYPSTPSPPASPPKNVHLGWSESSKQEFDATTPPTPKLRNVAGSAHSAGPSQHFKHVALPARPLDERVNALTQTKETERPGGGGGRRGSLFTGFLEARKDKVKERRRDEIKKSIRLVTESDDLPRRLPPRTAHPELRSASVDEQRPVVREHRPTMGFWSRRMSELGLF